MPEIKMETRFEPSDPDYQRKVQNSFARQGAMQALNITIERLEPGWIELKLPYQKAFTQQHGFLHAGIISTALDSACGYAAFSLMPKEAAVLSVEFKVNLLSPAKGDSFRVVGHVIKPGKTITVCQAEAYAYFDHQNKLIAQMAGTIMAVYHREGIQM